MTKLTDCVHRNKVLEQSLTSACLANSNLVKQITSQRRIITILKQAIQERK